MSFGSFGMVICVYRAGQIHNREGLEQQLIIFLADPLAGLIRSQANKNPVDTFQGVGRELQRKGNDRGLTWENENALPRMRHSLPS